MNVFDLAYRRGRHLGLFRAFALLTFLGLFACEAEVIGQQPALSLDLEQDPTGAADHLIDFGETPIGSTASRTISIRNSGAAPLALDTSSPDPPFAIDVAGPSQVAVGGSRPLEVSFSPKELRGEEQGLITLRTNEGGDRSDRTIRLVGRAVKPLLDCEATSIDFGEVLRGMSVERSLRCTNSLGGPLHVVIDEMRGNHRTSFRASFPSGEASAVVEAGGAIELSLAFDATTLGLNDASFSLRDENEQLLAQLSLQAEVVPRALRLVGDGCLDFGYVGLGEEKIAALRLRNVGSEAARIVSLQVEAGGRDSFSVRSEVPLEIPPGSEQLHEVEVAFHPGLAGFQSADLEIMVEDQTGKAPIHGCVSGFGGGPKLSCTTDRIDFGQVALGLPVTRSLRCVNDGVAPEGASVDPLVVEGLSVSLEVFQPRIIESDGSLGPKARGYEIGEGFQLEIAYAPEAERLDEGVIRLESPAAEGGVYEVRVLGEGRVLPPCEFSLIPPQLRFGSLERGDSLVQEFGIRNEQGTACLVNDLHLVEGSDPAFSVEAIGSVEIAGWETLRVPVRFAPTAYGDRFEGRIRFQISSEDDRIQEVSLSGSSAQACLLVRPKELDFGKAMPGCQTPEQTLVVSNVCGVPVSITEIELNETLGSDAFDLVLRPTSPAIVQPNRKVDFTMIFNPEKVGEVRATVAISVEGMEDPYLASVVGEGIENAIQTDHFEQPRPFKSDILWVIDNSTSFDPFQRLIADNLPAFLTHAKTGEFRIAVTSSGLLPEHFGSSDPCPGGAGGGEDGRFFPIDGSHPRILTPQTADLELHWRHNMMVGACHALEEPIEAALRALTPPLIDNAKDPRHPNSGYQDGNAGFLREEAELSIIFVTDQMDHSFQRSLPEYLRAFRRIKGPGRDADLKFHAITIPPSWSGLPGCGYFDWERSDRIMYLVEETGGTWVNLCDASDPQAWEEGMKEMSQGTFGYGSRFVPRGIPGDRNGDRRVTTADLEVRIDGEIVEPIENGSSVWIYDPGANAVNFTPFYIPAPGAQISITYRIACAPGGKD